MKKYLGMVAVATTLLCSFATASPSDTLATQKQLQKAINTLEGQIKASQQNQVKLLEQVQSRFPAMISQSQKGMQAQFVAFQRETQQAMKKQENMTQQTLNKVMKTVQKLQSSLLKQIQVVNKNTENKLAQAIAANKQQIQIIQSNRASQSKTE